MFGYIFTWTYVEKNPTNMENSRKQVEISASFTNSVFPFLSIIHGKLLKSKISQTRQPKTLKVVDFWLNYTWKLTLYAQFLKPKTASFKNRFFLALCTSIYVDQLVMICVQPVPGLHIYTSLSVKNKCGQTIRFRHNIFLFITYFILFHGTIFSTSFIKYKMLLNTNINTTGLLPLGPVLLTKLQRIVQFIVLGK